MKRVVAGVIGLAAGAALVVGCSDDSGKSKPGANSPSATASPQVSSGGKNAVQVDAAA